MYHWSRRAMPRWLQVTLWGVLLLDAVLVVLIWWGGPDEVVACLVATVLMLGTPAVVLALRGRLTVDERALVLELAPIFRKTIPRSTITAVEAVDVHPLRDFGGYGYRLRGGGVVGFVFEAGPGVRVRTTAGKSYVISDPAAERLAAALRDRSTPAPHDS